MKKMEILKRFFCRPYPKLSSCKVWIIIILSLVNIMLIVNQAKIQTINIIHKINRIYVQKKKPVVFSFQIRFWPTTNALRRVHLAGA